MSFPESPWPDCIFGVASSGPIPEDIHGDCRFLISCALKCWRHTVVSSPEHYLSMMRVLVKIDIALEYAFRPDSNLKKFEDQVQMIQYEVRQLSKEGAGPDFTYRLTTHRDWNCYFYDFDLRDPGWKETPIGRTPSGDGTKYYVHTSDGRSALVYCSESGLVSVKEVLLGFYRGTFPRRFSVLDNPTFHYLGLDHQTEWPGREGSYSGFTCSSTYFSMSRLDIGDEHREMKSISNSIHIFAGIRPRFHLLMSFEHQSQLYTIIKPAAESNIILKDTRGALHSCADVLDRHNAQGRLGWTLYQLRSSGEQEVNTLALQSVELSSVDRRVTRTTSRGLLQSLLHAWEHIVEMEKQPERDLRISWLFKIGTIPMAIKQKYAGEKGLTTLAERWECMPFSGYMDPEPFFHSVLGNIYRGSAIPVVPLQEKQEIQDIFKLNFFVKGLRGMRFNYIRAQHPQDSVDTIVTRFLARWSKYRHPNVLSLKGIRLMPRKGIGLVFPRTQMKSLHEYVTIRPDVDRCQLCAQVSSGLTYLHEAGVIHGDLRAANLLVSITGEAIISDPIMILDNTLHRGHTRIRWMAPEIIKGAPQSQSSDVYSLGMTLLEIITGAFPYAEKSDAEVLDALSSEPAFLLPERPEESIPKLSKHGNDLWRTLFYCWSFDRGPNNRLLAAQVVTAMESITQDGLKQDSREKLDTAHYTPEAFRESFELSEMDSESLFSSGHSTSNYNHGFAPTHPMENEETILLSGNHSLKVAREIVRRLALHGCENLTDHVDVESFGQSPLFRGGFGDVFSGSLIGSLRVAVKTHHISPNILDEDPEYIKNVAREIHTWSKCDHPNVLHFLGLAVFRGQIGMVAPWMENGSLPSYLRKTLSADRCKLCTEVCEGVAYLHEIGIVHGDLKGENVLISSEGTAVVSDFGGSLLKNRSLKIVPLEKGLCLTYRWAAPELLMQDGMDDTDEADDMTDTPADHATAKGALNTKESDIYALGMTILEVISGRLPWYWINSEPAIIMRVCLPGTLHKRPKYETPTNSHDGNKLWDMLTTCWSFAPDSRPPAITVGDIMRTITPGGLKAFPPPARDDRCALFDMA